MPPSPSPLMGGTKTCEHVLGGTAAVRRAPGSDMATLSETHVESAEPFAGKPAARHMSSNVAAQMQPANAAAQGQRSTFPPTTAGSRCGEDIVRKIGKLRLEDATILQRRRRSN
mmetsp:Transcript_7080/g.20698  ORF Transcript_7080/g.20698 Transcript_7080/m.20698 type:complete len:114 (-) Transcript_7080:363-704(-)